LTEAERLDENRRDEPMKKDDKPPVLCGTDFSATATEAVDIAAATARRLETSLILIHVDELLGALTL